MEDFTGVIDISKRALASCKIRKAVEVLNEKQGPEIYGQWTQFLRNRFISSFNFIR